MCILKKIYKRTTNPKETFFLELRREGDSSGIRFYIKNNTSVSITDIELDADNGQRITLAANMEKGQDYSGNVDILVSQNLHLKLYCKGADLNVYKARKKSVSCHGRDCSVGAQESNGFEATVVEPPQLNSNNDSGVHFVEL